MRELIHTYMTAVGMVSICSDGESITAVYLPTENLPAMEEGEYDVMRRASKEIDEYLAGKRKEFDVPTRQPGTEFQTRVWDAISRIPYGSTMRYSEIAGKIGNPKAARAVGTACGSNRIPIIIPCHRVVASTGIGKYLGGTALKKRLLALEKENR